MRRVLAVVGDVVLLLAGLAIVAVLGIPLASILYVVHLEGTWDIHVVEIRNESGVEIEEAVAEACAHQLRAAKIVAGGSVAMRFRLDCDGSYGVKVRLASGQSLGTGELYIVSGLRRHDTFTVTAERIEQSTSRASAADLAAARR